MQSESAKQKVSSPADRQRLRELDGLFVGQLTEEEMESLRRCREDGYQCIRYEGIAGQMLGMGRIKFDHTTPPQRE